MTRSDGQRKGTRERRECREGMIEALMKQRQNVGEVS